MTEWKEYITADTLTLAVAIATLVAAIAALVIAKRSFKVSKSSLDVAERSLKYAQEGDRQRIINDIASKEAQLKSMEFPMRFIATNDTMIQREMLKAEIEQLKQQLKSL